MCQLLKRKKKGGVREGAKTKQPHNFTKMWTKHLEKALHFRHLSEEMTATGLTEGQSKLFNQLVHFLRDPKRLMRSGVKSLWERGQVRCHSPGVHPGLDGSSWIQSWHRDPGLLCLARSPDLFTGPHHTSTWRPVCGFSELNAFRKIAQERRGFIKGKLPSTDL